jgi:hypothetical protein
MAEIINLRKARKAKARAAEEEKAAVNRAKFGRRKEERSLAEASKELLDRKLDAHRREDDDKGE